MDSLVKEKYYDALEEYDNKNFEKAFQMLSELAKQGVSKAQMEVGYMLYEGDGVNKDIKSALYWFKTNIEDNSEAVRMVGWCYLKLNQNKKGIEYLEKAIELKNMDAYDNIGYFYDIGEYGFKVDKQKALEYYKKGCSLGLSMACQHLLLLLDEMSYDKIEYIQKEIGWLKFIRIHSNGKILNMLGHIIKCFFYRLVKNK